MELAGRLEGIDPFGDDVALDDGIMKALPAGCKVLSTSRSGNSLWVETMRIDVELPDGTEEVFFKKGAAGDAGLRMMRGAFDSEEALYRFIPEYVPRPVAVGTYESRPDAHFFLAEFVDMEDEVHPDVDSWATCVSTLHKRSMGKSPSGKFGFHTTAHLANIPINTAWTSTWEQCFAQILRGLCEIEERQQQQGPSEQWKQLKKVLFDVIIPRYLRPLESDGRSVQPCLLHCDLWPGNTRPRTESPETLCVFDSAAIWGHNESDLGITRPGIWNLESHGARYRELIEVSYPQSEYETRLDLYSLKGMILRSAMYATQPERRVLAMQAIQKLADKVAIDSTLGFRGMAERQDDIDASREVVSIHNTQDLQPMQLADFAVGGFSAAQGQRVAIQ